MNKSYLLILFLFLLPIVNAVTPINCTTINVSGAYELNNDIIDSITSNCITIEARDVILDCKGHTIDSTATTHDYAIYAETGSSLDRNITIKNCTFTEWDTAAIYFNKAGGSTFENLIFTDNPDLGLKLAYSHNNILDNINSSSNNNGIAFLRSDNCSISNITTNFNNLHGFHLDSSDQNTLTNITSNSNSYSGLYLDTSDQNTFTNVSLINNTVADVYLYATTSNPDCDNEFTNVTGTGDKPILFFNDTVTIENWNNNFSQLLFCDADGSTIRNVTASSPIGNNPVYLAAMNNANIIDSNFSNLSTGIILYWSISNTIENSTFNLNADHGVYFYYSDSNTLRNLNTSNNNDNGFYFHYSDLNTLRNITANSNQDNGIYLFLSDSNTISNITLSSNADYGLSSYSSEYNTINDSKITDNTVGGAYLWLFGKGGVNLVYNNLFNNTINLKFETTNYNNNWNTTNQVGTRIFSNGTNIGGNFWAYPNGTGASETCTDANKDGFCDASIDLSGDGLNIDYLPLSEDYIPNDPPNASPILVSVDQTNSSFSDLNCSANITDPDGDDSNVTVRWYKNDILNFSINYSNDYPNDTLFYTILNSQNTSEHDIWKCSIELCDWRDCSEWLDSNNLTILDTTNPDVNLTYPLDVTYTINIDTLNYTYSDNYPDSCWYSNDSGVNNYSVVNAGTNWTGLISNEGSNTWTVYCNDTSGNENSDSVVFFKDTVPPSPAGGGGGGSVSHECSTDSDCQNGTVCHNYNCVSLFDVKILKIDSPINQNGFFNFTYLVKSVSWIDGDVVISFWLEKDDIKITSGYDTVYFSGDEEKIETTNLFLPSETPDGVYNFYVQASYGDYKASSSRLVEVAYPEIKIQTSQNKYISIIGLIMGLIILIFLLIITNKIKFWKTRKKYYF